MFNKDRDLFILLIFGFLLLYSIKSSVEFCMSFLIDYAIFKRYMLFRIEQLILGYLIGSYSLFLIAFFLSKKRFLRNQNLQLVSIGSLLLFAIGFTLDYIKEPRFLAVLEKYLADYMFLDYMSTLNISALESTINKFSLMTFAVFIIIILLYTLITSSNKSPLSN